MAILSRRGLTVEDVALGTSVGQRASTSAVVDASLDPNELAGLRHARRARREGHHPES